MERLEPVVRSPAGGGGLGSSSMESMGRGSAEADDSSRRGRVAAGPRSRRGGYPAAMESSVARERILAAVRAIPPGQVAGYGEVARRAGLPGRARLVARILSANEDPALPWHRVLRSDGRIALEPGSDGWREQAQRLRAEGVEVVEGRVRPAPRAPGDGLDALLWGPDEDPARPAGGGAPRRKP